MNDLGKKRESFLFLIDFEFKNAVVLTKEELDPYNIKFSLNNFSNSEPKKNKKKLEFNKFPVSLYDYQIAYDKVKKEINTGNTYLLNLSFQTKIQTNFNLKRNLSYKSSKIQTFLQ